MSDLYPTLWSSVATLSLLIQSSEEHGRKDGSNADEEDRERDDEEMKEKARVKRQRLEDKRSKKQAELATAEHMAQSIFSFHQNTSECTRCTGLQQELNVLKFENTAITQELQTLKEELLEKDLKIENLTASIEAKKAVIKNMETVKGSSCFHQGNE